MSAVWPRWLTAGCLVLAAMVPAAQAQEAPLVLSLVPVGGSVVQGGQVVDLEVFMTTRRQVRIKGGQFDLPCIVQPQVGSGTLTAQRGSSDPDGNGVNTSSDGTPFAFGPAGIYAYANATCISATTPGIGQPTMVLPGAATRYLGTITYQVSDCAVGNFSVNFQCTDQSGGLCEGNPEGSNTTRYREDEPPGPTQGPLLRLELSDAFLTVTPGRCCAGEICLGVLNRVCCENLQGTWSQGLTCEGTCLCTSSAECDDDEECTTDSCVDGQCVHDPVPEGSPCNDGLYCTPNDLCTGGACLGSGDPCPETYCSETLDACVQCMEHTHCDDGSFCNGAEPCGPDGQCLPGSPPCRRIELCDEANDLCQECLIDSDCSDDLFCTMGERCADGQCLNAVDPCGDQLCDESNDRCVDCLIHADCDDQLLETLDSCIDGACSHFLAPLTLSLVPVSGTPLEGGETFEVDVLVTVNRTMRIEGGQYDLPCEVNAQPGGSGSLMAIGATGAPEFDGILGSTGWPYLFGPAGIFVFSPATCIAVTTPGIGQSAPDVPGGTTWSLGTVTFRVSDCAAGEFQLAFQCTDQPGGDCDRVPEPTNTTRYREDQPPGPTQGPLLSLHVSGANFSVPTGRCCRNAHCTGQSNETCCFEVLGGVDWQLDATCEWPCPPCITSADCDDGLFCTGYDLCEDGQCVNSGSPCGLQFCDETHDRCVNCTEDNHCDDNDSKTIDVCLDGNCTHSLTALTLSWVPLEGGVLEGGDIVDVEVFMTANRPVRLEGGQFDAPRVVLAEPGGQEAMTVLSATADPDGNGFHGSSGGISYVFGPTGQFSFDSSTSIVTNVPGINQSTVVLPAGTTRYLGTLRYRATECAGGEFHLAFECTDQPTGSCDRFPEPNNTTRYRQDEPPGPGIGPLLTLETATTSLSIPTGRCCRKSACPGEFNEYCCREVLGGSDWQLDATCDLKCPPCETPGDCDDDNPCTIDVCADGDCTHQPGPDGPACDDGLFCTAVDMCQGGICGGSGDPCTQAICNEDLRRCVECQTEAHCDDGNPCTTDLCFQPAFACSHLSNTSPCDDGLYCTVDDRCDRGECGGSPRVCDVGQVCVEESDDCGPCTADAQCEDSNPCTAENCQNGLCFSGPDSGPCDDGLFCTAVDTCTEGVCTGTGDPCAGMGCIENTDSCGCTNSSQCDDGNPCTSDFCSSTTHMCGHTSNTQVCNDGRFCTINDRCGSGVCTGQPRACPEGGLCDDEREECICTLDTDCGDGLDCTLDICLDEICTHSPGPDDLECHDGLFCTIDEHCSGGQCVGMPVSCGTQYCSETLNRCADCVLHVHCDDGNALTIDACDSSGTCSHQPSPLSLSIVPVPGSVLEGGVEISFEAFLTANRQFRVEGGQWDVPCVITPEPGGSGTLTALRGSTDPDGDGIRQSVNGTPFVFRDNGLSPYSPASCITATTPGIGKPTVVVSAGATRYLGTVTYLASDDVDGTFHIRFECTDQPGGVCSGPPRSTNTTRYREDEPPGPGSGALAGGGQSGASLTTPSGRCCAGVHCLGVLSQQRCMNEQGVWSESLTCENTCPCSSSADCDDGNVCTTDRCDASGVCTHAPNRKPCDDGLYCTKPDSCANGVCVGVRRKCPPGRVCDEDENRCVPPGG